MVKRNLFWLIIILLIIVAIFFFMFSTREIVQQEKNTTLLKTEVVAQDLTIPWEIAFLPDNEMLVTERIGNLVRIGTDKKVIKIQGVRHQGEGGLLGLALHPNFDTNKFIYLYFTSDLNGSIENRVERYKFDVENNVIADRKVILSGIPGSSFHDGGRITFGPDGYLYITTGDATNEDSAQEINSLAGKVLRIDENGAPVKDNPFKNEVYSYGHRNPQGIAWDDQGGLWITEHGRSGVLSGFDELNFIEKGKNYGWPIIQGDEEQSGMEKPIIHSGSDNTWAPAGAVYHDGNIFFTGLRGETLYRYDIQEKKLHEYLKGEFGRLRAITIHNNALYISTSNKDGRGDSQQGDDKIIKVDISSLS